MIDLLAEIPAPWRAPVMQGLLPEGGVAILQPLQAKLEEELTQYTCYPPREHWFEALHRTPFSKVKAVLLGQDPYHETGQAMGLSFAVPDGITRPPSLRNIIKEYENDLQRPFPAGKSIAEWADAGLLMLNTVLTVRKGEARSHFNLGWLPLVRAILRAVNAKKEAVAFLFLGKDALAFRPLIDETKHAVISVAHPAPPFSCRKFLGSRPFSQVNQALICRGQSPLF